MELQIHCNIQNKLTLEHAKHQSYKCLHSPSSLVTWPLYSGTYGRNTSFIKYYNNKNCPFSKVWFVRFGEIKKNFKNQYWKYRNKLTWKQSSSFGQSFLRTVPWSGPALKLPWWPASCTHGYRCFLYVWKNGVHCTIFRNFLHPDGCSKQNQSNIKVIAFFTPLLRRTSKLE